jgi:hypothetical protein
VQVGKVTGYEMPVKDWEFDEHAAETGQDEEALRAASRARHAEWGRQLARQFRPAPGKTNLFFQLGTQHVPRMAWTHEGVIDVLGDDAIVIGSAASDYGYIIWEGETIPHALLGVMVSGDFAVALAGSEGVDEDRVAETFEQKLQAVIDELDGRPDLTLYIGCAGWRHELDDQHQVAERLLGDAPLFGSFAGGEVGRMTTAGEPYSDGGLLFVVGVDAGDPGPAGRSDAEQVEETAERWAEGAEQGVEEAVEEIGEAAEEVVE